MTSGIRLWILLHHAVTERVETARPYLHDDTIVMTVGFGCHRTAELYFGPGPWVGGKDRVQEVWCHGGILKQV